MLFLIKEVYIKSVYFKIISFYLKIFLNVKYQIMFWLSSTKKIKNKNKY